MFNVKKKIIFFVIIVIIFDNYSNLYFNYVTFNNYKSFNKLEDIIDSSKKNNNFNKFVLSPQTLFDKVKKDYLDINFPFKKIIKRIEKIENKPISIERTFFFF